MINLKKEIENIKNIKEVRNKNDVKRVALDVCLLLAIVFIMYLIGSVVWNVLYSMYCNLSTVNYIIDSTDYNIELLENGDVLVNECWNVRTKNTEAFFTRDMESPGELASLFSFDELVPVSFKINGVECEYDDGTHKENTYRINNTCRERVVLHGEYGDTTKRNYVYEFRWNKKTSDVMKYEASYKLTNAVKNINNEYAGFALMVHSSTDYAVIKKLTTNIKMYNNSNVGDYFKDKKINKAEVKNTYKNVIGNKSVGVVANNSEFNELGRLNIPLNSSAKVIINSIWFLIKTILRIGIGYIILRIIFRNELE